jgi:hypothetical protein
MKDLLYYAQLALESIVAVFGVRPYEQPQYAVLETLANGVEIRRYAPRVAAEASATGENASAEAFNALFRYISGAEKIAMTAPVASEASAGGVRMQFYLPARYSAESAPKPADPRIRIVPLPEERLAVVRFSGRASVERVERQTELLLEALAEARWHATGTPVLLGYDPPFTLPFLRRNEVAVPVAPR